MGDSATGFGAAAEAAADKYHGVAKFDVISGTQAKTKSNAPAYTNVFGQSLTDEAARDGKIVAVTAAMPSGTGLDIMAARFPARVFDVGIAEQHGVTFAAGLAAAVEALWRIYSGPTLHAWQELTVAARTDPELMERIIPVMQNYRNTTNTVWLKVFREAGYTPTQAKTVAKAQVLFSNGLGFEGWMARLLKSANYKGTHVVATQGADVLEAEDDDHDAKPGQDREVSARGQQRT